MKKIKYLTFLIIISFAFSCKTISGIVDFDSFSEGVFKAKKRHYPKALCSYLHPRVLILDSLDFINYNSDTVFILQSWEHETSTISETLWTKKKKISYEYMVEIKFIDYHITIRDKVYNLIERWDIEKIRELENSYSGQLSSDILAIRVIINNYKMKCDFINFLSFFPPGWE